MAEYNFGLDDVGELQHALSQFTGAQFSQAPTSAYQHQQPLSQQPPLPPLPPVGHHPSHYVHGHAQRPSSVSSVGRHSIGMGHRTDSVESVFTSPGHTRVHAPSTPAPRLPPRDYVHNAPSGSGTFISDAMNSTGGGYAYARARNSSSTGDILDSNLSSRLVVYTLHYIVYLLLYHVLHCCNTQTFVLPPYFTSILSLSLCELTTKLVISYL